MGDVAILVPVLNAIIKQNQNIKITVLTQKHFAPIFKDLQEVNIHFFDKKIHKGISGLFQLYKELKIYRFNSVADIHNVIRTKILKLFFFGTEFVKIDKGRKEKRALISKKSFHQLKTSAERYADVFRKLRLKANLSNPIFPEKQKLPNYITSILKTSSTPTLIGVAPFAAHKSKMYGLDKIKLVLEDLSLNYNIFLFGGKNDAKKLENFETNNNIISLAGKLTFSEELNIISNLDCMISMDSGNAHLAAMYGIKVISIWGATHPFAGFAPFNQPNDFCLLPNLYVYPKIPTSVYGNKYPKNYENAASSIPVDVIIHKVKSILETKID